MRLLLLIVSFEMVQKTALDRQGRYSKIGDDRKTTTTLLFCRVSKPSSHVNKTPSHHITWPSSWKVYCIKRTNAVDVVVCSRNVRCLQRGGVLSVCACALLCDLQSLGRMPAKMQRRMARKNSKIKTLDPIKAFSCSISIALSFNSICFPHIAALSALYALLKTLPGKWGHQYQKIRPTQQTCPHSGCKSHVCSGKGHIM